MSIRQDRIKKREAGKCDSPSLQFFGIRPIKDRADKKPIQLSKFWLNKPTKAGK